MNDEKKLIWSIDKVYNWEKNPRAITNDEFEKLKWKIKKYGQFKPLVITPEGEILGGNMRYRAYKDMGITDVWVSIVNPKDDTEKLEISLADNESAGYYVKDELAELIQLNDIDRDLFKLSLDDGKKIDEFMQMYSPVDPTEGATQQEPDVPEVMIEIKTNKSVLMKIKATLDDWEAKYGIEYNLS